MSSIKRRIRALEDKSGGTDPLIVYLKSFVDDPDGSPMCAIYVAGPNKRLRVDRGKHEAKDAFLERVRSSPFSDSTNCTGPC